MGTFARIQLSKATFDFRSQPFFMGGQQPNANRVEEPLAEPFHCATDIETVFSFKHLPEGGPLRSQGPGLKRHFHQESHFG
jgi:hypothetical protein